MAARTAHRRRSDRGKPNATLEAAITDETIAEAKLAAVRANLISSRRATSTVVRSNLTAPIRLMSSGSGSDARDAGNRSEHDDPSSCRGVAFQIAVEESRSDLLDDPQLRLFVDVRSKMLGTEQAQ